MIAAPVIQTAALSKTFGEAYAVRNLDLIVEAGRITGFLGRNGAGKSTTIKMLLGLTKPTEGEGTILGRSIADPEANRQARQHIAYVAEDKPLYRYMTVGQTLGFASSFYDDWQSDLASKLLREFELPLNRRVKALSKGMRTKLALLLAFSRNPDLLILDEPSEGLDPVTTEQLLQLMVAKAAQGTAIFFSSHQIAEVERIADQVCILDRGCLLLDSSLDRLRQSFRRIDLVLATRATEKEFQIRGVERIETNNCHVRILASENVEAIVQRARNLHATSVEVIPIGLREIFLETVGDPNRALV
jgi:ABC-2 type transport system ATP-binding protein